MPKGLDILALNNQYTMAVARGQDAKAAEIKKKIDQYHADRKKNLNMKKK